VGNGEHNCIKKEHPMTYWQNRYAYFAFKFFWYSFDMVAGEPSNVFITFT